MQGLRGVVLTDEPPQRLAFTWGRDELHFAVDPVDDRSSRLTLVNVLDDRTTAARKASGWHICLAELAKPLDGVPSRGPHSEDTEPFEPVYQAHVDAGLPSGAHPRLTRNTLLAHQASLLYRVSLRPPLRLA